jgi:hypothetical protein
VGASQTVGRVPDSVIEDAAQVIAHELLSRLHRLGGRRDRLSSWEEVCGALDVLFALIDVEGGPQGRYFAFAEGDEQHPHCPPIVAVNVAYEPMVQVAAAVHELAHHFLETWMPVRLKLGADLWLYDDDRAAVHERIAALVVRRVLG